MLGKVFTLIESVDGSVSTQRPGTLKWDFKDVVIPAGSKVKVVMVSRFGDVGITTDLDADFGYIARVCPSLLREC